MKEAWPLPQTKLGLVLLSNTHVPKLQLLLPRSFNQGFSEDLLTSWVPPQDELTDLIIDEDEKAVGEGAEPPQDPEEEESAQRKMEEEKLIG